jgi:hypothetical protein
VALRVRADDRLLLEGPSNALMGRGWPPRQGDLEEAERICRALELGPLLDRMPAGLQQQMGETGWKLSHGEKSRRTSPAPSCNERTSLFSMKALPRWIRTRFGRPLRLCCSTRQRYLSLPIRDACGMGASDDAEVTKWPIMADNGRRRGNATLLLALAAGQTVRDAATEAVGC